MELRKAFVMKRLMELALKTTLDEADEEEERRLMEELDEINKGE